MSQLFEINIKGDLLDAMPRIKDQAGFARALARRTDYENQLTIATIQRNFLSGPTTDHSLSVRTNRLRGSINASKTVISGTGVTSSIGSNVIYAPIHEFGFDKDVTVHAHQRNHGKYRTTFKRDSGRRLKNKILIGGKITHTVGTFTRHMKMGARRPIGNGIQERVPAYSAAYEEVTGKFLKGENQ